MVLEALRTHAAAGALDLDRFTEVVEEALAECGVDTRAARRLRGASKAAGKVVRLRGLARARQPAVPQVAAPKAAAPEVRVLEAAAPTVPKSGGAEAAVPTTEIAEVSVPALVGGKAQGIAQEAVMDVTTAAATATASESMLPYMASSTMERTHAAVALPSSTSLGKRSLDTDSPRASPRPSPSARHEALPGAVHTPTSGSTQSTQQRRQARSKQWRGIPSKEPPKDDQGTVAEARDVLHRENPSADTVSGESSSESGQSTPNHTPYEAARDASTVDPAALKA